MLLAELRTEVARYAQKMYHSQLVRATQGNLSARDDASGLICITPSGYDYELMTAEDIVVVDADARIIEGERKPSSELPVHTYLFKERRDIRCIMHTHSVYASAFSVVQQPIPMVLAESAICLGSEVPVAPFRITGTPEFAQEMRRILGEHNAVLWGNHGVLALGETLQEAFSVAHALEDSARIYAIARQLGTPTILPDEAVQQLHAFWQHSYGQK